MCTLHLSYGQTDISTTTTLGEVFGEYGLVKSPKNTQKSNNGTVPLSITISDGRQVKVELTPATLLASNYEIHLASSPYTLKSNQLAKTYYGQVKGSKNSAVRLTIQGDFIYGYIEVDDIKNYIEPAYRYDSSLEKDLLITYRADQVKKIKKIKCASDFEAEQGKKVRSQVKSAGTCQLVDMAIGLDWSYVQDHGGETGAINQSIAVMNMVAGSYEGAFADDIRFEIVEHFVSDCSSCDPWTSSTNANVLLDAFTSWGPSGFSNTHDVGMLWSNRNFCDNSGVCDVAGLAWVGALCTGQRYLILEDFTTTSWQLRVLVAHELGHMFGASHDASGSSHIMAPSITTNTETWSSTSVNTINADLPSYTCLVDCVIGSCSEIASISVSGCQPGNPSTYNLTMEVRHGGGGGSSSFDVIIDGNSYTQSWTTSPQIVTIPGLTADGVKAKNISISASDNSDTGCSGSFSFDAPSADCSVSIVENFDNCTLPSGWTAASTNIYSWNGGDPLVQYEWKFDDATRYFANYDDQSNASSLKTIDGTCMAFMDDDIINHDLYTGVVTLTTDNYDVSGVDELRLKFDYNFHPFEDGGKGENSSYFEVEVYNGSSWTRVLYDDNSDCSWFDVWGTSCITAADIDVTAHINAEFSIRFIYSDGNNAKWAGMIALDNLEVAGTLDPPAASCDDGIRNGTETAVDCGGSCTPCSNPCEDVVMVSEPITKDIYEARTLIMTSGTIQLNQNSMFMSDNTEVDTEFEVPQGTELTIVNDGCN